MSFVSTLNFFPCIRTFPVVQFISCVPRFCHIFYIKGNHLLWFLNKRSIMASVNGYEWMNTSVCKYQVWNVKEGFLLIKSYFSKKKWSCSNVRFFAKLQKYEKWKKMAAYILTHLPLLRILRKLRFWAERYQSKKSHCSVDHFPTCGLAGIQISNLLEWPCRAQSVVLAVQPCSFPSNVYFSELIFVWTFKVALVDIFFWVFQGPWNQIVEELIGVDFSQRFKCSYIFVNWSVSRTLL
jgi:hypothetical protein